MSNTGSYGGVTEVSNGSFWLGRQEVAEEEEADTCRMSAVIFGNEEEGD